MFITLISSLVLFLSDRICIYFTGQTPNSLKQDKINRQETAEKLNQTIFNLEQGNNYLLIEITKIKDNLDRKHRQNKRLREKLLKFYKRITHLKKRSNDLQEINDINFDTIFNLHNRNELLEEQIAKIKGYV